MRPDFVKHESLLTLARAHGVQPAYHDMSGQIQEAAPEVLIAVLNALGVAANTENEIRQSLADVETETWRAGVEPVVVAWDKKPVAIDVRIFARDEKKSLRCSLQLEDGSQRIFTLKPERISERARIADEDYLATRITLPALPFGYHKLKIEIGDRLHHALVISAPTKVYSKPGARDWGIFLPMFAARSANSWGAGNFSDWKQLCTWVSSLGGSIAGALPLLATFLDNPACDPSPYSPASRLFWNEFYLDIERVPELAECIGAQTLVRSREFQKCLQTFRKSKLVDYEAEWKARRSVLELLAKDFFSKSSTRRDAFDVFVREQPEIEEFARFRAVCDRTKQSWHDWPSRLRDGILQRGDYDEATRKFHLYVQWLTQEQVAGLIAHCRDRELQFYLDLPLGVHPSSYDVWRNRKCFARDASVGAPPDSFFTQGQDWGFAPLHPQRVRADGYRYVIDFLRFQMRHTGRLRIDHVMGLHRLFWIPKGFSPRQGVYVRYPAEEWLAILSVESHRHQTVLVGENLGTVPPEVNESMTRHELCGMYVLQYEQQSDPKAALRLPPTKSVASINTHDLPPFAAHWRALDITDHARMGWIAKNEVEAKRARRKQLNAAMVSFLKRARALKGKADTADILNAALVWLGSSPAEAVLVNLEDLLLEKLPQNTPGTYKERPNWRRKAKLHLEKIFRQPEIQAALQKLSRARKRRRPG